MEMDCNKQFYDLVCRAPLEAIVAYHKEQHDHINLGWRNAIDGDTTAFIKACQRGDAEVVVWMLRLGNIQQGDKNRLGRNTMLWAVNHGHEQIVRVLVENRADIEERNAKGMTALMEAASKGYIGIVTILLQAGANVNNTDALGNSALDFAAKNGRVDIVELLASADSDLEIQNRNADITFKMDTLSGHDKMVDGLIQNSPSVETLVDPWMEQDRYPERQISLLSVASTKVPLFELASSSVKRNREESVNDLLEENSAKRQACTSCPLEPTCAPSSVLSSALAIVDCKDLGNDDRVQLWDKVSDAERLYYENLWDEASEGQGGKLHSIDAVNFFRKSKVMDVLLNDVWRIASQGEPCLNKYSFGLALRCIALLQDKQPLTREAAMATDKKLFPGFCFPFDEPYRPSVSGSLLPIPGMSSPKLSSEIAPSLVSSRIDSLPMRMWSVEDVCALFTRLGADPNQIDILRKEAINGAALMTLEEYEMRDELKLGVGIRKNYKLWAQYRNSSDMLIKHLCALVPASCVLSKCIDVIRPLSVVPLEDLFRMSVCFVRDAFVKIMDHKYLELFWPH
eukprot:CAMPEP_0184697732 /NCGR_PEP_ID=MMETSP0313-20130426/4600_1 /TAXON_ID=2792 /ORGANISM="Porphyridium aerugineum, Strain SAG 1380-2" /LENGTH=568 /DNA_ID=CAMNT_0027156565 /DNA_START=202 /DNA_END=1908 /DNA_ORIENTATION=-